MNANKKSVLLRFAPERRPRLYSVSGQFTPPSNVIHPAYHGSAAHVNQPSCDSACDSMRRGFFFAFGGVAGAAARRRGSRGGRNGPSGTGGHRGSRVSGRLPRLIVGLCTSRPAAQQPSHKSSPRTCCYGSSPSARARYPHTAAAARPRTPSGSYAARRSAAAGTPSPLVSHPAIRPGASCASGNPSPGTPTQSHRTPNASLKPICPSDSPGGASLSSSRQSRTAARSATGAAPKRR